MLSGSDTAPRCSGPIHLGHSHQVYVSGQDFAPLDSSRYNYFTNSSTDGRVAPMNGGDRGCGGQS